MTALPMKALILFYLLLVFYFILLLLVSNDSFKCLRFVAAWKDVLPEQEDHEEELGEAQA
jgi:hypothetical protein